MSRVSVLEQIYSKKKSALEFNYDSLSAPPILSLLSLEDVQQLRKIATSLRYNGNIDKKYEMIDEVMNRRGFRKAHSGTNRVVYNYLEDPRFVAKIAIDKVGMRDTPAEFKNQEYFKPFCCKIFEVDPSGVIGFVERVNPITSLEEFLSVSDDIFNMIITKIVGKYVLDDIGASKFMNFGQRMGGFGPVILDFPYAYKLDGCKLICNRKIDTVMGRFMCGGEIDYDGGFNYLHCTKCGKTYQARDLAQKENNEVLLMNEEGVIGLMSKARLVDADGAVILDDCTTSKTYISKKQYETYNSQKTEFKPVVKVNKIIKRKRKSKEQKKKEIYNSLVMENFNRQNRMQNTPFADLFSNTVKVAKNVNNETKLDDTLLDNTTNDIAKVSAVVDDYGIHNIDTVENDQDNTNVETNEEVEAKEHVETENDVILNNEDEQDNEEVNVETEYTINNEIIIGSALDAENEPDYSNYVPPEEEPDNEDDTEEDSDFKDEEVASFPEYINNKRLKKPKIVDDDSDIGDY